MISNLSSLPFDLNEVWFEVLCSVILISVGLCRALAPSLAQGVGLKDAERIKGGKKHQQLSNSQTQQRKQAAADQGAAAPRGGAAQKKAGTPSNKKELFAEDGELIAADENGESSALKRRIQSLFYRANAGAPGVLQAYDKLVEEMGLNKLREQIRDTRHAQALYLALIAVALDTNANSQVGKLLADMHRMEISMSLGFFANLLRSLASRGKSQESVQLYTQMRRYGVEPDPPMYICLMNDAISHEKYKQAAKFFEELCELELPSLRTLMTGVRICDKLGDWRKARDLLAKLRENQREPDNLIFNTVLSTVVKAGEVDAAAELLEEWVHLPILDAISFNTVLKGYAQAAEQAKAELLLQKMLKGNGPAPTLITWNTMMDCAVRRVQRETGFEKAGAQVTASSQKRREKQGSPRSPPLKTVWDYLGEMEAAGLTPDRYTCSTLVKGMGASGGGMVSGDQIDRAIQVLRKLGPLASGGAGKGSEEASADQKRLYEVLFNSLLDACVNSWDLERMAAAFAAMRDAGVAVSAVTFGTLIKAFGNAGKLSRCHECWAEMRKAEVKPTVITYGCYVDAMVKNGELDRAAELVSKEMPQEHLKPNTVIYTMLLKGCARQKDPQRALAIYKEMEAGKVERSSVTFNIIAEVVSRQGRLDLVREVLQDMRRSQVKPGSVIYSILLKGLTQESSNRSLATEVVSLFREAQDTGLILDEACYNSVVNFLCKAALTKEADEVLRAMREHKMVLTAVNYSVLVKAFGQARSLDQAFGVVDDMRSAGLKPNVYTYTCLMHACCSNGEPQKGLEAFQEMRKAGLDADEVAYGTLINGMIHANRLDDALSLAQEALGAGTSKTMAATTSSKKAGFSQASGEQPTIGPVHLEKVVKALSAALQRAGEHKKAKGLLDGMMARTPQRDVKIC